jgi:hypothetical protein
LPKQSLGPAAAGGWLGGGWLGGGALVDDPHAASTSAARTLTGTRT